MKLFTLSALFFALTAIPAHAGSYFECNFKTGSGEKARFIVDTNTLGGVVILKERNPYSYVDGREGDTITKAGDDRSTQLAFDMSSTTEEAPAVTAFLTKLHNKSDYYSIKMFVTENGATELSTGLCLEMMHGSSHSH